MVRDKKCRGYEKPGSSQERSDSLLVYCLYSLGECVVALKSMIGSTAQQFLTFLSHRGEETGNIRGSMKVRVPTERLGTRERLYGGGSIGQGVGGACDGVVWGRCRSRPRVAVCWNPVVLESSAALTEWVYTEG